MQSTRHATLKSTQNPRLRGHCGVRAALVLCCAFLGLQLGTPPAQAQATGIVEVASGHESSTLDVRLGMELLPRILLFTRHKVTVDYENKLSYFGYTDLAFNLIDGLDIVFETQYLNDGLSPRAGFEYFKAVGDFSFFTIATVLLDDKPDGELYILAGYTPALTDALKLLTELELVTNIGGDGHNFSAQGLRVGVEWKGLSAGLAGNVDLVGVDAEFAFNLGGFLRKTY